jgi:hypothetical protein
MPVLNSGAITQFARLLAALNHFKKERVPAKEQLAVRRRNLAPVR